MSQKLLIELLDIGVRFRVEQGAFGMEVAEVGIVRQGAQDRLAT